jgi:hypothetical protein
MVYRLPVPVQLRGHTAVQLGRQWSVLEPVRRPSETQRVARNPCDPERKGQPGGSAQEFGMKKIDIPAVVLAAMAAAAIVVTRRASFRGWSDPRTSVDSSGLIGLASFELMGL